MGATRSTSRPSLGGCPRRSGCSAGSASPRARGATWPPSTGSSRCSVSWGPPLSDLRRRRLASRHGPTAHLVACAASRDGHGFAGAAPGSGRASTLRSAQAASRSGRETRRASSSCRRWCCVACPAAPRMRAAVPPSASGPAAPARRYAPLAASRYSSRTGRSGSSGAQICGRVARWTCRATRRQLDQIVGSGSAQAQDRGGAVIHSLQGVSTCSSCLRANATMV